MLRSLSSMRKLLCPPGLRNPRMLHLRSFTTDSNTNTNANANANENTTTNESVKADVKDEEVDPRKDLSHRIKNLEKHIEDSAKHLEETKKELLITLADAETTRRIAKKDVDAAKAFGIQNFATAMLDIADNLRLALESVAKESLANNPQTKSLHDGVEMTEKLLLKTFTKFDIHKIHPLGEKFDPKIHQGLVEVVDPTKEAGTVAYVMKSGYKLKDRLLRPASVGVVKAAPKEIKEEHAETTQEKAKAEGKQEPKKEEVKKEKKLDIVDVD